MAVDRGRAVLIALERLEEGERLLLELELLLANLDVDVVERVIQKRDSPDPAFFLGSGKARDLKRVCDVVDAGLIVSDRPLTPRQMANLKAESGRYVWDRPLVIMKIFEERARTSEAKLQVELARCRYELPHLRGLGHQMSRLGGGIGTRGPGETEFERHRRKLERRIRDITRKLAQVKKRRRNQRKRRSRSDILTVAMVGYTNSGKSTLLRRLSGDRSVYVADALFATLDTLVRSISMSDGRTILLTDTVGFIRELPPALIAAFRTTLEEAVAADFLLVMLDGSDPDALETLRVVRETLRDIDAIEIPRAVLLNKADLIDRSTLNGLLTRIRSDGEDVEAISASKWDVKEITPVLEKLVFRTGL